MGLKYRGFWAIIRFMYDKISQDKDMGEWIYLRGITGSCLCAICICRAIHGARFFWSVVCSLSGGTLLYMCMLSSATVANAGGEYG